MGTERLQTLPGELGRLLRDSGVSHTDGVWRQFVIVASGKRFGFKPVTSERYYIFKHMAHSYSNS